MHFVHVSHPFGARRSVMNMFFSAAADAGFGHLPLPTAIDWNEKRVAATVLLRIVRGAFA